MRVKPVKYLFDLQNFFEFILSLISSKIQQNLQNSLYRIIQIDGDISGYYIIASCAKETERYSGKDRRKKKKREKLNKGDFSQMQLVSVLLSFLATGSPFKRA